MTLTHKVSTEETYRQGDYEGQLQVWFSDRYVGLKYVIKIYKVSTVLGVDLWSKCIYRKEAGIIKAADESRVKDDMVRIVERIASHNNEDTKEGDTQ